MVDSATYTGLRDALFWRAALEDDFRPRDLIAEVIPAEHGGDILLRGQLASALRAHCSVQGDRWQLRPIARRKALEERDADAGAMPDTEIATALRGEDQYTEAALDDLLDESAPLARLDLAVSTLAQAGPKAPGHSRLVALSSALDHRRALAQTDAILAGGFIGRENEVAALMSALDDPQRSAPLRTVHIRGAPGFGKTFLLEELSRQCRVRPRVLLIRLDFDQAALSGGAVDAVYDEISRQIALAMPKAADHLNELRMQAAARRTRLTSASIDPVPYDLLAAMIEVLAAEQRQPVFLLDTLEVLHGRGATFIGRLLDDLDRFADKGQLAITVISAGRGDLFSEDDPRLQTLIPLHSLDREIGRAILEKRGVDAALHDDILDAAKGNPLRLILVTRALEDQDSDGAVAAETLKDAANGYLYRSILSRVPLEIRQIAAEGLVLTALGPDEMQGIIGPALDMEIDSAQAVELTELLAQQSWMLKLDRDGKLMHRTDVRAEMLSLTYDERGDEAAKINSAAVTYYASRDRLLNRYHRLQLIRVGEALPELSAEDAQLFPEALIEELPPAAQDAVLRARGARSRVRQQAAAAPTLARPLPQSAKAQLFRADPKSSGARLQKVEGTAVEPDKGALSDLRNMLEQRELREASSVARVVFADPTEFVGEAAALALTHQWLVGHWSMVRALLPMLQEDLIEQAMEYDMPVTGLALLEIWAEFRMSDLRYRLRDPGFASRTQQAIALVPRLGLRGGALSMACKAEAVPIEEVGSLSVIDRFFDPDAIVTNRTLSEISTALRSEFGLSFNPIVDGEAPLSVPDYAVLAAPLNPYVAPLRALIDAVPHGAERKFDKDIASLKSQASKLANVYVPQISGVEVAREKAGEGAEDVLGLFTSIGLTAELLGGYSFYSPIADVPTIARAAQRWQDATLGRWGYVGPPPSHWQQTEVDPLALDRAQRILGMTDAEMVARDCLQLWDDPSRSSAGLKSPSNRLRKAVEALPDSTDLPTRIAALSDAKLPNALIPPIAALIDIMGTRKIF